MTLDQKVIRRQKLRWRIRRKVSGTASKPRLSVFRSNRDIYVQLIDDANGVTLVAASSREFHSDTEMEDQCTPEGDFRTDLRRKRKYIESRKKILE